MRHRQGVIHRDIKPSNILIDSKGRPRVTDFGLAKRVDSVSDLTATGQILGTPSYMPPEQAAGQIHAIGPAADVYALGAVLYAALTGRPPFQAATPLETLKKVIEREPVALRQLNAAVPRDLETIVLKCLEKSVPRRYASADVGPRSAALPRRPAGPCPPREPMGTRLALVPPKPGGSGVVGGRRAADGVGCRGSHDWLPEHDGKGLGADRRVAHSRNLPGARLDREPEAPRNADRAATSAVAPAAGTGRKGTVAVDVGDVGAGCGG